MSNHSNKPNGRAFKSSGVSIARSDTDERRSNTRTAQRAQNDYRRPEYYASEDEDTDGVTTDDGYESPSDTTKNSSTSHTQHGTGRTVFRQEYSNWRRQYITSSYDEDVATNVGRVWQCVIRGTENHSSQRTSEGIVYAFRDAETGLVTIDFTTLDPEERKYRIRQRHHILRLDTVHCSSSLRAYRQLSRIVRQDLAPHRRLFRCKRSSQLKEGNPFELYDVDDDVVCRTISLWGKFLEQDIWLKDSQKLPSGEKSTLNSRWQDKLTTCKILELHMGRTHNDHAARLAAWNTLLVMTSVTTTPAEKTQTENSSAWNASTATPRSFVQCQTRDPSSFLEGFKLPTAEADHLSSSWMESKSGRSGNAKRSGERSAGTTDQHIANQHKHTPIAELVKEPHPLFDDLALALNRLNEIFARYNLAGDSETPTSPEATDPMPSCATKAEGTSQDPQSMQNRLNPSFTRFPGGGCVGIGGNTYTQASLTESSRGILGNVYNTFYMTFGSSEVELDTSRGDVVRISSPAKDIPSGEESLRSPFGKQKV